MHLVNTAFALAAVAAMITAVLASHHQTSTDEPPFFADIRHIIKLVETAAVPPPASDTPGFKCRNDDMIYNILHCEFDTKPTLDQAKAIMAAFKSMNAEPRVSTYRKDTGTLHKFTGGKWT